LDPAAARSGAANKHLPSFEPELQWARHISVNNKARRRITMLAFQLIGLAFVIMFIGALVTNNPSAARR